jgi:subtilisin family serine protease
MASPHVAGVAALVLGNSRSLTPAQVASVISTDATPGIISGLTSSTANTFLFQRVSSAASSNFADFAETDVAQQNDVVDESSAQFDNVTDPETGLPVVKPGTPSIVVKKAVRAGNKIRVTVSAPAGAVVKLYRNGKLVAAGKKGAFLVPKGKALSSKFHAVTNFDGALMVSNSVVYSTSARR